MALVSNGTGGQADKIATGSIGQRPSGKAGMIRHCTTRKELVQEPGSTIEFYDSITSQWQQLASYFEVEGIEIVPNSDVNLGFRGSIPKSPALNTCAKVIIPKEYDSHYVVSTMGFICDERKIDPAWEDVSYQMTVWASNGSPQQIAFNTTQPAIGGDEYVWGTKFNVANTGVFSSDGLVDTTFETKCNMWATKGGYAHGRYFDINLSVLSWRTLK